MLYTSFTIQHLIKGAVPKAIAILCHAYGGCMCGAGCKCETGATCETCHYTYQKTHHNYTVVDMPGGIVVVITTRDEQVMQIDMYTEEQFDFYGLRALVENLKGFSVGGHLTMTHLHRDLLPGEVPPAAKVDEPPTPDKPPKPEHPEHPPKPHK